MRDLHLALRQLRYEQKLFWRNPASAFFTFVFPLMFLVIFATVFKDSTSTVQGHTVAYNYFYVPALLAFALIGACFTNIAITLTFRRDSGLLKRVRGTPLPPWVYFAGVILSSVVLTVILTVITTGFGALAYQTPLPHHPLVLIVQLLLGATCFCALGLAVAALIPNADAAPAVTNGVLFPVLFISGLFFEVPNATLSGIANLLPIKHMLNAVVLAFDPAQTNQPWDGGDIAALLLYAAAGVAVALRYFRWEPNRR